MKLALVPLLVTAALLLSGCGHASNIAGQAASAAASAAVSEAGRQAGEAVDAAVGPVCKGLKRAENSLSALAQGRAETVGEAKQQIADARADLQAGEAAESIGSQAALAGVTAALDGFAKSLAPLDDQAVVQAMLQNQRAAVSGVSVDEEMTNLVKFQRAFQASAHLVSVVDQLLGIVVNLGE